MENQERDFTVTMSPPGEGLGVTVGPTTSARPPRRPKVLMLPAEGSDGDLELRELLRRRLRSIALVVAAANAINVLQYILEFDGRTTGDYLRHAAQSPLGVLSHLHLIIYPLLAFLAAKHPPRPLRELRLLEAVIFLGGLNYTAIYNWRVLIVKDWLPGALEYGSLLPDGISLNWFFIIVGYGTLIPNTGRRCAALVSGMALFALALNAVAFARNQAAPPGQLVPYLLSMILWMMYAVVISILGSHRLERLRREVVAARQLGQYRLSRRLGAGGMGEVYLAEHVLLRRPCAVKLIHPDRAGDPRQLARFEREVQATATLSHPNTIQIYDYGHTEYGTFYYAMEYLEGLNLEQLVEQHGPLPAARTVHFLRQICGSLNEAHSAGLVHRDIKPSNVIVCTRGGVHHVAKLLDFGLVLPRTEMAGQAKLTQDGSITGTPSYMSPEQASEPDVVDARSDIYSLGALAYFLLTGRPPFIERSVIQVLAAHLHEAPKPLRHFRPDVPAELDAIILRCLAKQPSDRFSCVRDLENAVASCALDSVWRPKDAAE